MEKDSDKSIRADEPFEEYIKSERYKSSFKRITFSTPEDQDNDRRAFSASLTHLQRMEYLHYLNKAVFHDQIKKLPARFTTLYLDE
jgi:hypothetical protein